jgi:hypothetical protein
MSGERKTRGTSVSELLEYKISYDGNRALQWHPLVRSKELAIALSYYFPEEKDTKEKMRAAIKRFLRDQRKIINVYPCVVENPTCRKKNNSYFDFKYLKICLHLNISYIFL